jgi:hypothetical protein
MISNKQSLVLGSLIECLNAIKCKKGSSFYPNISLDGLCCAVRYLKWDGTEGRKDIALKFEDRYIKLQCTFLAEEMPEGKTTYTSLNPLYTIMKQKCSGIEGIIYREEQQGHPVVRGRRHYSSCDIGFGDEPFPVFVENEDGPDTQLGKPKKWKYTLLIETRNLSSILGKLRGRGDPNFSNNPVAVAQVLYKNKVPPSVGSIIYKFTSLVEGEKKARFEATLQKLSNRGSGESATKVSCRN